MWFELMLCNVYFCKFVEYVKCGILEVGGFLVEFLVFLNGELNLWLLVMFMCNFVLMDVEEVICGNLIDVVVLFVGCDKMMFVLLMGVVSCDVLVIVVLGGLMFNGKFEGKNIGLGMVVW